MADGRFELRKRLIPLEYPLDVRKTPCGEEIEDMSVDLINRARLKVADLVEVMAPAKGQRLRLKAARGMLSSSEKSQDKALAMLKRWVLKYKRSILKMDDEGLRDRVTELSNEETSIGRKAQVLLDIDGQYETFGKLVRRLSRKFNLRVISPREGYPGKYTLVPAAFRSYNLETQKLELERIINSAQPRPRVIGFFLDIDRGDQSCPAFWLFSRKPKEAEHSDLSDAFFSSTQRDRPH